MRLATNAGAVYSGYPSDVPSTAFTLRVTVQALPAYSNDFDDSKLDRYRIALKSILPHAITGTFWNNEWVVMDSIDKFWRSYALSASMRSLRQGQDGRCAWRRRFQPARK